MNEFISRKRFSIFIVLAILVALYIIITYGSLAMKVVPEHSSFSQEWGRGTIVDRNGKPLAVSTNFYHLSVTPSAINDVEKTATVLAPALQMSASQIIQSIQGASRVFYLKKRLDETEYDTLKKLIQINDLNGLKFDKIPGRVYPEHDLASQLIGFMGDDGEGLAGIEYSMQRELAPVFSQNVSESRDGQNVYLTIDANLQYKLEKIALNAIESTQAESVMMVAADGKTGEILSYISLPSVDLNQYRTSTPAQRQDRPAVVAYEPGSVFKVFSVATFFDAGLISRDETFVCDGRYDVSTANGERVRITCLDHHGAITAEQALQYSCNDALAQMSARINSEYFINKLKELGFGSRTGVNLPGETAGLVKTPSDRLWSGRSKPTISIGQEISVSALQMVRAATALTNHGTPLELSVVSRITDQDNNDVLVHTPQAGQQVFSDATAAYLLECMKSTAQVGTGHRAALGDIAIGVKTGTAQMIDTTTGGYSETDFISNCIAVFPAENPQIILYIVITKAKGETYAGRIVAPVVAEAADVIIDHMGLSRESAASLAHSGLISVPAGSLPEIVNVLPDFTGIPKRSLTALLTHDKLNVVIKGDGYVVAQNPPAGTPVTEGMTIEFYLD